MSTQQPPQQQLAAESYPLGSYVPPPISERIGINERATSLHATQKGIIADRMRQLRALVSRDPMPPREDLLTVLRNVETDLTLVADVAWSGAIEPLARMHESAINKTQTMLDQFTLHSDPGMGAGAVANCIVVTDPMNSLLVFGGEGTLEPINLSNLDTQTVNTVAASSRGRSGTSGTGRAPRKGKQAAAAAPTDTS